MKRLLLEPGGGKETSYSRDGAATAPLRAMHKRNVLIVCILCVGRLIAVMVKTVIGMII